MRNVNRWDIYFRNNPYACFVTDKDSGEILYYNDSFKTLLHLQESVVGKTFAEVIGSGDSTVSSVLPNWGKQDVFETEIYNRQFNMSFQVRAALMYKQNVIFTELTPVEFELQANRRFENAISKCMEIYLKSPNKILISFMELLCEFYQCERAYVYRFNFENNTINCVSQWCEDTNFRVTEEIGTKMDSTFLMNWLDKENEAGIVMASRDDETFKKNITLQKIMDTFQMENLILCTVEDVNHKNIGLVGMSNRSNYHSFFDKRLINTISRFVAQDVSKGIHDATLFELHHRDALTGMFNRAGYAKQVDLILQEKPKNLGVLSVNINGLKFVNENLGSNGGDELIRSSSETLKNHFGYEFYRMSGDEFVGIVSNIEEKQFNKKVTELHTAMRVENNLDFSFGHAWGSGNFELSKLLLEADTVMYINKQEYYSKSQRKFDTVGDSTLSDLLSYLSNDEFFIYLQPQVVLKDGSPHGAEALIRRFDKANQKMVFPDQFIPLYEQKSVIRHIDIFVLEKVCSLLQEWLKQCKEIPISVNLSRVTLQEFGIVDTIVKICNKYHVPHKLVIIEVTERVGLIENNVASSLIQGFKDNGFKISLDDFGCAYSNIVTLAQIEVDEVKIDKSLVDNITINKKNRVLVKNVLLMCEELEETTSLAEGIEEEEQANMLDKLGCQYGQGYFFSRPIPVDEFVANYL